MINPDYWKKLKDGLDYIIAEHKLEKKQIYVLPADEYAVNVIEYLRENKFEVEAVLDNRSELVGETLCGIPIKEVQDSLYPFCPDGQVVLATSYWNTSLIAKLDFIECWHNISRFLLCEDIYCKEVHKTPGFTSKVIARVKAYGPVNILRRSRLHRKAQAKLDELTLLSVGKQYLFPHASIGDIFILGTYLSQNNEKFRHPFTLIVIGNACKKIAIRSGFEHVISIDQATMDMLLFYKMFMGDDLKSVEILHYDFIGRCICNPIFDQKKFTFYECYECMVFGEATNFINQSMESHKANVTNYCKQNGIVKGKTVILAPYNKSIPDISPVFWETLARELRKLGYTVITNSSKTEEQPVYQTQAVGIPLETINEIVEYAGYFIGVRSGLCDVISGCNAQKIVVSPKLKGVESTVMDFYGFKYLSLEHPIDEIECKRIPDVQDTVCEILSLLLEEERKGKKKNEEAFGENTSGNKAISTAPKRV